MVSSDEALLGTFLKAWPQLPYSGHYPQPHKHVSELCGILILSQGLASANLVNAHVCFHMAPVHGKGT